VDARGSQVQAIAVRSNRILLLGTNDEIRQLAGPRTQIIDAKGRTVLPALVDSHTHPNLWAVEHWLGAKGHLVGTVARHGSLYKFGVDRWAGVRPDFASPHKFRFDLLWRGLRVARNLPSRSRLQNVFPQSCRLRSRLHRSHQSYDRLLYSLTYQYHSSS